jgi:hypothetical protein
VAHQLHWGRGKWEISVPTFNIYSPSNGFGLYYVVDPNDGNGDNIGQLGDVSNDRFTADGIRFTYVGTAGQGFVGTYNGNNAQYYFTNNSGFQAGDPFPAINYGAPFTIACYLTGTRILTPTGETPVEALAIGDEVITASGASRPIKWIGRRSYSGRFANGNAAVLPICFNAGSIADGVPARDLRVSPKHAMFIDGVLIAAEHLVNGVTIHQADRVDEVCYWHVELDSHDVLLAEGAASESFVDDHSRAMFHNAAEFAAAYPDVQMIEAVYCAPRVQDGHTLHAVRKRLAARAGIAVDGGTAFGAMTGEVALTDGRLTGWASNACDAKAPVCLDVLADGVLIGRLLAREPHPVGQGFNWPVPAMATKAAMLELRRSADGVVLSAVALNLATAEAIAA